MAKTLLIVGVFLAVTVTHSEKPRIKKPLGDPVTKTVTAGFNVTFHCDVVAGSPKPTITWYFGWTDRAKKVDKQYDDRYSHPDYESWTITGIEKNDEGKYRCIAENEAGQATLRVDIQKVNVPPTIDPFPQNVYDEGDKVDFECKASGDPKPTVEWRRNGYRFPKQTTKTEGEKVVATITFNKITLEDTGEYTCLAFNDALDADGEVIVRKETANLYVNSPPKINEAASVTPVYSFVRYQKPVIVKCVFYGYPIPTVKMVAPNGTEVASGQSEASVTLTTDSLDDFGLYNCSAENKDNETAEFSIELKVAVPPGPPSNVSVITTCNTIKLRWNPPKDNGGMPVESYVIRATGPNVSHTENVTQDLEEKVIDSTFQPSTDYKITIKATTATGPGDLVELQPPVTTKQYCKPGRPSITNTNSSITGTSFTLTWAPPIYDGGDPILQYKVKWAKKPITEDTKWEESDGLVDGTSLEITDLSLDTEYEFHVYARNQESFGEPAIKAFKVEPLGKPGRPSITNTDSSIKGTSFTLTWAPPINDGGDPILQYKVKWAMRPITEDTKWEESDGLVNGTSLEITDLSPDTQYEIHVYARNQEGFGEPAIKNFTVEPEAATGNPTDHPTPVASKPGRPIIYSPQSSILDSDTFTLMWRRPKKTGGDPEISYKVRYTEVRADGTGDVEEKTTKDLQIEITCLKMGTKYKFEVFATNKGGDSEPTIKFYQLPSVGVHDGAKPFLPIKALVIVSMAVIYHVL